MLTRFAYCLSGICWVLAHNDDHNAPDWMRRWCELWQSFWHRAGCLFEGTLEQSLRDGYEGCRLPWRWRVVFKIAAWPMPQPAWMED